MLNESSWVPTPKPRFQSLAALPITLSSFSDDFPTKLPPENVPVLRRRKYTRQQRKSLIIEPDTSLILAAGLNPTSSSDEEQKQREPENVRTRYGAKRRIKKRFHSTSNLKSAEIAEKNDDEAKKIGTTKSLSVRDLNGDNIDFNNRDSVKKWTSQIFAELESIPSSRRGSMDANSNSIHSLLPKATIINIPPCPAPQVLIDFKPLEPLTLPSARPKNKEVVGPNFLRDLLTASYSSQYPESSCSDRLAASDTTQKASRASSFEWVTHAVEPKYEDGSSDEADREVALIGMSKQHDAVEQRMKNFDELEKSVHELESLGTSSWFPSSHADTNHTLPASFRNRAANIGSIYDNATTTTTTTGSLLLPELLKLSSIAKSAPPPSVALSQQKSIRIDGGDEEPKPFSLHNLPAVKRLAEFNVGKPKSSGLKPKHVYTDFALQLAERDAANACSWLRKSGYAKYADQFEEGRLPIHVETETSSSGNSLEPSASLSRRISILNRCHAMKVDSVPMRRATAHHHHHHHHRMNNELPRAPVDAKNDDNLGYSSESWSWTTPRSALSSNKDHVYSGSLARRRSPVWNNFPMAETSRTTESRKVMRTDWYEAGHHGTRDRSGREMPPSEMLDNASTAACVNELNGNGSAAAAKLQRSQSERIKDRARAIMKKMDLRTNSKRPKEARARPAPVNIGDPVLLSYDTPKNSIRSHHIDRPSILPERGRQLYPSSAPQSRSKSIAQNRRVGLVFMSPTSPDANPYASGLAEQHLQHQHQQQPPRRRELSMPPSSRHRVTGHVTMGSPMFDGTTMTRRRELLMPFDSYLYPGHNSLSDRFDNAPSFEDHGLKVASMFNDGYFSHDIKTQLPRHNHNNHNNHNLEVATSSDKIDEPAKSTLTRRSDSGLGSSLSRSPSGPYTQRIRHSLLPYPTATSFVNSTTTTSSSSMFSCGGGGSSSWSPPDEPFLAADIDSLSLCEMTRLRRAAHRKLTSIMKTTTTMVPHPEHDELQPGKNVWSVQRLIKRMKIADGRGGGVKDADDVHVNNIFGVGLDVVYQRTGYFLPRPILEVMCFLRSCAPDTLGLFRKNGVKSRIAELRAVIDGHAAHHHSTADVFVAENRLDATQVHDVADLLKQYFRDLPEPLMTVKMSEVFANVGSTVPDVDRLAALQCAVVLLPDEHREALKTLLLFLKDVSRSAQVNQMSSTNLSVCFTPSLFHLSASRLDKERPSGGGGGGNGHGHGHARRHKTVGGTGLPSEREMREAQACQASLTMLIEYAQTVFMVPDIVDDVVVGDAERGGGDDDDDEPDDTPNLTDLGLRGPRSFLVDRVIGMIRDQSDGWKQWTLETTTHRGIEVSSRRSTDSLPLKTFRVWVDVPAAPKSVMMRILKERHIWDTAVINWRHVEFVNAPDTDIHQYVVNETIGHPTRDCHVARFFTSGLTEIRGACAIAERSVRCHEEHMLGGVTATVFDQRFLIEPSGGGHSRVNYIARVDLKGRSLQWYNKSFGSLMCRQMDRLRDSFHLADKSGPETNV